MNHSNVKLMFMTFNIIPSRELHSGFITDGLSRFISFVLIRISLKIIYNGALWVLARLIT